MESAKGFVISMAQKKIVSVRMTLGIVIRESGMQAAQVTQSWDLPNSGKEAEREAFERAGRALRAYWAGDAVEEVAGSAKAADEASDIEMGP